MFPIITNEANAIQAQSTLVNPLHISGDNAMNDDSIMIALPTKLGLPKGMAITPETEIKVSVTNT